MSGAEARGGAEPGLGIGGLSVVGVPTAVITIVGGSSLDGPAGDTVAACSAAAEVPEGAAIRIVASGAGIGWVSAWLLDFKSAPHDPQVAAPSLTPEPH